MGLALLDPIPVDQSQAQTIHDNRYIASRVDAGHLGYTGLKCLLLVALHACPLAVSSGR